MKIGILGTGDVGRALGTGFVTLGHDVKLGGREAGNAKAAAWAKSAGTRASTGTFADAAAFGELLVLATLGEKNEEAIRAAGVANFKGKIVIDATNPLDHSQGTPPVLLYGPRDSGGEQVQRLLPEARVVKAFNTVGNAFMFKPDFPGGPPDMFIAGNDTDAKRQVTKLLGDFGWNVDDLGGIASSRYLEAMCMAWVMYGATNGSWNHAFKLLKKK
ncbi:MAG TPA: NAD(P)-binding domain-containing protein [Candidatus Saccharimonadaceae bacterium]|jgi:predicted dinucleotide-binding enzyme|nr:NAD(P)-binding domain-containing protein [Candidatus Saccharimonadaceae bacterium]